MEGPCLVDRLWEAHVTFFLLHNKLLQVAIWLGSLTVSLSKVLTTWQTLVYWSVIYLCEAFVLGVRSFGSTLCTLTWYQSFYEEPLLLKLWKGFWFSIFCAFVAYESCSIASGVSFPLGNSFRFTENCFRFFQKHPFRQIWRYNVTVTVLFFLNLSYFISIIIRSFCFSLGLFPSRFWFTAIA